MLLSVNDITKVKYIDSQVSAMYSFDDIIFDEINEQDCLFPKLYRNLNKHASLKELSNNICDDFGLPHSVFDISEVNSSYYIDTKIHMTPFAIRNNNIEALFHEFAHLFQHLLFKSEDKLSHHGDFVCVFRWLLDHYGLVSKNDFNEMATYFAEDLVIYDDYIESFKFINKDEFETLYAELSPLHTDVLISDNFLCSRPLEKKYINTEKQIHTFVKNEEKNIFIYTCINKLACHYNNPIFNMSLEELKNTVVVSPAFLMNQSGHSEKRKYFPKYYGFIEADGESFDNPFFRLINLVKLGDDSSSNSKKLIQKEITQYSTLLKKHYERNVIRTKSESEFNTYCNIMRNHYFSIRNN